ncbi:dihydrofolate reductase [Mycoplasmopsis cynos]|nr:dihydrofolate reductase [Mycoplasmopsis cynos]UWV92238.1 dihydrofolate reductase [Mycoplasmopsis cynos]
MINAILNITKKRIIGYNNKIPWNAPEYLKFFAKKPKTQS